MFSVSRKVKNNQDGKCWGQTKLPGTENILRIRELVISWVKGKVNITGQSEEMRNIYVKYMEL